jgi:predicted nucleic acid-binding protein
MRHFYDKVGHKWDRTYHNAHRNNAFAVRDAIHASVMINRGIKIIASFDKHFDCIKEIKRIEP